jgi:hypothetical protein
MPEAAGAVAAGAVADRLLGPRERRQLAIVLVVDLCHGMLTHVLICVTGCAFSVVCLENSAITMSAEEASST